MEACRVSNWNVREGHTTADSKLAANLELENLPSFYVPHLPSVLWNGTLRNPTHHSLAPAFEYAKSFTCLSSLDIKLAS